MINQRLDKLNFNIVLNNMKFVIETININVDQTMLPYNNWTSRKSFSMIGYTDNQNYIKFNEWQEKIFSSNKYKVDYSRNGLNLYGIFPTDYDFTQNRIRVQFSMDYFEGDLELFKLSQLRKEKLLKINKISNYV